MKNRYPAILLCTIELVYSIYEYAFMPLNHLLLSPIIQMSRYVAGIIPSINHAIIMKHNTNYCNGGMQNLATTSTLYYPYDSPTRTLQKNCSRFSCPH